MDSDAPSAAFWAFGEQNGVGGKDRMVASPDGSEVDLGGLNKTAPQVKVLLTQGAGAGEVIVSLRFEPASKEKRYTGIGTITETNNDEYGPATCTQSVPMLLSLERYPGWIELSFTKKSVYFNLIDGSRTCTKLDADEDMSYWNTSYTADSFSLGESTLHPTWVNGTFNEAGATGYGSYTYLDITTQISFTLTRTE